MSPSSQDPTDVIDEQDVSTETQLLDVPRDEPLGWFRDLQAEARRHEAFDADRAAIATVSAGGAPRVRYVLVRGADAEGFVFYTNYRSPKARELEANPLAALAYHWHTIGVQVRVEGPVARASEARSDRYFAGRGRGSQLGAWASPQSAPIADRDELRARVEKTQARFPEGPVPRPAFWGGYVLKPEVVEFWFARESRLHDRYRFTRTLSGWGREQLAP